MELLDGTEIMSEIDGLLDGDKLNPSSAKEGTTHREIDGVLDGSLDGEDELADGKLTGALDSEELRLLDGAEDDIADGEIDGTLEGSLDANNLIRMLAQKMDLPMVHWKER